MTSINISFGMSFSITDLTAPMQPLPRIECFSEPAISMSEPFSFEANYTTSFMFKARTHMLTLNVCHILNIFRSHLTIPCNLRWE